MFAIGVLAIPPNEPADDNVLLQAFLGIGKDCSHCESLITCKRLGKQGLDVDGIHPRDVYGDVLRHLQELWRPCGEVCFNPEFHQYTNASLMYV